MLQDLHACALIPEHIVVNHCSYRPPILDPHRTRGRLLFSGGGGSVTRTVYTLFILAKGKDPISLLDWPTWNDTARGRTHDLTDGYLE